MRAEFAVSNKKETYQKRIYSKETKIEPEFVCSINQTNTKNHGRDFGINIADNCYVDRFIFGW